MRQIRAKEAVERRFLGALRFLDGTTGGTIQRSLDIRAKGLRFIVNRSYLHVIVSAEGLEEHADSFAMPPDLPLIGTKAFDVFVSDPSQKYLPRIKRIELPRNPDRKSSNSLFEPIQVPMFSAACADLSPNWSVLRLSVFELGPDEPDRPLPGALVRIVRSDDGRLLAKGLTDHRGESLVAVPAIPLHSFVTDTDKPDDGDEPDHTDWLATGDVVEQQTSVRLEVVVDGSRPWPVDPEALEEKSDEWHCKIAVSKDADLQDFMGLKLKTGKTETVTLFVKVPEGT
jgi:hypothetical protein